MQRLRHFLSSMVGRLFVILLLGMSVATTSYVVSASSGLVQALPQAVQWGFNSLEFLLLAAAMAALYHFVPNTPVRWGHAWAGGVFVSLGMALSKKLLGLYLATFTSYQRIYGALAALPILLLWIYLCWLTILLGASFASAISAFRYQPTRMRLPVGFEMYGLLRLIGRFHQARKHGKGLHIAQILELEPILTDALVQQFIEQLSDIDLLRRAEDGEWLLARDIDGLTLSELYEACGLRVPIAEAHLPCRDDALGVASIEALDKLRLPLRDLLKRNVADLYANEERSS